MLAERSIRVGVEPECHYGNVPTQKPSDFLVAPTAFPEALVEEHKAGVRSVKRLLYLVVPLRIHSDRVVGYKEGDSVHCESSTYRVDKCLVLGKVRGKYEQGPRALNRCGDPRGWCFVRYFESVEPSQLNELLVGGGTYRLSRSRPELVAIQGLHTVCLKNDVCVIPPGLILQFACDLKHQLHAGLLIEHQFTPVPNAFLRKLYRPGWPGPLKAQLGIMMMRPGRPR